MKGASMYIEAVDVRTDQVILLPTYSTIIHVLDEEWYDKVRSSINQEGQCIQEFNRNCHHIEIHPLVRQFMGATGQSTDSIEVTPEMKEQHARAHQEKIQDLENLLRAEVSFSCNGEQFACRGARFLDAQEASRCFIGDLPHP